MIEEMIMKVRKADDEYRDEMDEVLKDLDCLRERLVEMLVAVDHFEEGLDKAKFEEDEVPAHKRK